jgi:hypothetical protein
MKNLHNHFLKIQYSKVEELGDKLSEINTPTHWDSI